MSKPFLFVIARGDSTRYELAMKHFGDKPEVEIVYDRRASDRRTRRAAQVLEDERRRRKRRGLDTSQGPVLDRLGIYSARRLGRRAPTGCLRAAALLDSPLAQAPLA